MKDLKEGAPEQDRSVKDTDRQFDCWVWTYRQFLRPAPRKPGWFGSVRKGRIATTLAGSLTLEARPLKRHEMDLAVAQSFSHELLPASRQIGTRLLELLMLGAGVGLILAIGLFFMPRGSAEMSLVDTLTNLLVAFAAGLAIVFIGGLLVSIPTLLRTRTVELFSLQRGDGRPWDFGVTQQQADAVVKMLESYGVESKTR